MSGHAGWPLSEWFLAIEQSEMGEGELRTLRTGAGPTVCVDWFPCFVAFAEDGAVFFDRNAKAGRKVKTPAELKTMLDEYGALPT